MRTCNLFPSNGLFVGPRKSRFHLERSIQKLANGHRSQEATKDDALNWTKQRSRGSQPVREGWFLGVISVRMSVRVTLMPQHSIVVARAAGTREREMSDRPSSACG